MNAIETTKKIGETTLENCLEDFFSQHCLVVKNNSFYFGIALVSQETKEKEEC